MTVHNHYNGAFGTVPFGGGLSYGGFAIVINSSVNSSQAQTASAVGVVDVSSSYLHLITSEHNKKPNFMEMVRQLTKPLAELSKLYSTMFMFYDVDVAIGQQLDYIGQWAGVDRRLQVGIENVYFSFDDSSLAYANLGFDMAVWYQGGDSATKLTLLPDDEYRLLIKMKILNNHWDGTIPHAYELLDVVFKGLGYDLKIKDNGNLTMDLILGGTTPPSALVLALFHAGKFDIKPAGISINYIPA